MLEISLLPFTNLYTERMELTRLTLADLDDMYELRSNAVVRQYLCRDKPKDKEEVKALIEKIEGALEKGETINWRMALKEQPYKMIGSITIWNIDKANHRGEMGYMLKEEYIGQRLMTEAMVPVLNYGLNTLKLHTLVAHIDARNKASIRLAENFGFVKEGRLREDTCYEGKFYDTLIYTLFNTTH